MIYKIYDMESRYKTYENLLSTQIICGIVAIQAACLVITATGTEKILTWTDVFPSELVPALTGFMTGLTYSNFFLPIIIWYQTNRIIRLRHDKIGKVLTGEVKFLEHFASLDLLWQRRKSID
uniref:Serpentine receptor class gamma n=1 Tax=Caenorhabditis tropicalis TaxID=1561998 RepID=A0A1I7TUX2_9PELO